MLIINIIGKRDESGLCTCLCVLGGILANIYLQPFLESYAVALTGLIWNKGVDPYQVARSSRSTRKQT